MKNNSNTRVLGEHFDIIDVDAFLASAEEEARERKLENASDACIMNPQFRFVMVPKSDTNDSDLICVSATGFTLRGKQKSILLFPTREFTDEDVKAIFKVETAEDGTKRYVPKVIPTKVYGTVSYADHNLDFHESANDWTYKWMSAVQVLENESQDIIVLHGDKRTWNSKDAEQ